MAIITPKMKDINNNKNTLARLNNAFKFYVNNPYSSFYKDKYQKAGVKLKSIKTIQEFESLPYLTKEEILSVSPQDFVFLPSKNLNHVAITSGTTNQDNPLILLSDIKSKPSWNKERQKPLLDAKIKSHLLLYPSVRATHRSQINDELTDNGIFNVVGDIANLPLTAKIAKRMQIDSIETTTSILYHFIPYLKKEYDLSKIKVIFAGGEYTSELKYKYLKNVFKNARFVFDFGSAETGAVAINCQYLAEKAPRFLHPFKNAYLETVGQKEEGELVITGLETGTVPFLLRYRTGNYVKLTNYDCPCGETKLMEMFGRIGHDFLMVQGTYIYSSQIYQLLSSFSKQLQTTDFKLHVYETLKQEKIMTRLVLQLIPKKEIKNQTELTEIIKQEIEDKLFLTYKNTLKDLIEKNIYTPLEIEFIESIPFSPKQTSIISHIY